MTGELVLGAVLLAAEKLSARPKPGALVCFPCADAEHHFSRKCGRDRCGTKGCWCRSKGREWAANERLANLERGA